MDDQTQTEQNVEAPAEDRLEWQKPLIVGIDVAQSTQGKSKTWPNEFNVSYGAS